MNLCRSSRIVVVSSHRGIFCKVGAGRARGHGDSDRSLFCLLSLSLYTYLPVNSSPMMRRDFDMGNICDGIT